MIALIAAKSRNGVIGRDGKIPWNIPNEKRFFKEMTMGHLVVMGRKSYEEIGRPLPGRTTLVVSKTQNFDHQGCVTVKSLQEAIEFANERTLFVAGGAALYKEALPLADILYLTEIDSEVEGDVYFPEFNPKQYQRTILGKLDYECEVLFVKYEKL